MKGISSCVKQEKRRIFSFFMKPVYRGEDGPREDVRGKGQIDSHTFIK